jgi:hypothetical protein
VGLDAVQRTGDHLATRASVLAFGLGTDLALAKPEINSKMLFNMFFKKDLSCLRRERP